MAAGLNIFLGIDLSRFQLGIKNAEKSMNRFSRKAERIGRTLTTNVTAPILAIGAASVATFAKFDRMERSLAAATGSAKAGAEQFDRLFRIVNDTRTSLNLESAAKAAIDLQSVGLSAKQAESTIRQLGIAANAFGATGDDVREVSRQLAQSASTGRLLREELRVIKERIPGLSEIIKNEFGVVTAEALRDAGVGANEFITRLTKGIEKSEKAQSVTESLAKSFESFGANAQKAASDLGETIATTINLQANLAKLTDFIFNATNRFNELSPTAKRFTIFTAGAAAAIGPFLLGLGAVVKTLPILRAGIGLLLGPMTGLGSAIAFLASPIGLAVAAVAALTAGVVIAYRNSASFRGIVDDLGNNLRSLALIFIGVGKQIFHIIDQNLKPFGGVLGAIGKLVRFNVSLLSGLVAVIAKVINSVANEFATAFAGIGDILSGNFKAGLSKLADTIANPLNLAKIGFSAKKIATTFYDTYRETLDSLSSDGPGLDFGTGGGDPPPPPAPGGGTSTDGDGSGGVVSARLAALGELSLELARASARIDAFGEKTIELPKIGGIVGFKELNQAIIEYRSGLDLIAVKQGVFGDTYDVLSEKISLARSAITDLLEKGISPKRAEIQGLITDLDGYIVKQTELNEANKKAEEEEEKRVSAIEKLKQVSGTAFDAMAQALKKGGDAFKAFTRIVLSNVREAISAKIKLAVTNAAASALGSTPFPLNIALASAAGAGASALFNGLLNTLKIPALADGAIATGATLALIGEGRESEAILPLSKLQSMIDMGGSGVSGPVTFRIDGDDLLAVMERGQQRQNRTF